MDVCEDPADVPHWSPAFPSRGQCGPTALVLNDLLGGDLVVAGGTCGEEQFLTLRARVLAALDG